MAKMIFIGVPYWLGKKDEYTQPVEVVRDSTIPAEFDAQWVDIAPDFDQHQHPVNAVNHALAQAIQSHPDAIPIIMAGDCTACIGAMKGLAAQMPTVLWYDAHGDFNTPQTSPSGFLGGMPLAAMVGRGSQWMLEGIAMQPIAESRVILVDARDLDPEEAHMVRHSQLTHLTHVEQVATHTWDGAPLYIHFDGDVLRLEDHPAVNYPAQGGASLQAHLDSLTSTLTQAPIAGVFVTLWNNHMPGADQSRQTLFKVIRHIAHIIQNR